MCQIKIANCVRMLAIADVLLHWVGYQSQTRHTRMYSAPLWAAALPSFHLQQRSATRSSVGLSSDIGVAIEPGPPEAEQKDSSTNGTELNVICTEMRYSSRTQP